MAGTARPCEQAEGRLTGKADVSVDISLEGEASVGCLGVAEMLLGSCTGGGPRGSLHCAS